MNEQKGEKVPEQTKKSTQETLEFKLTNAMKTSFLKPNSINRRAKNTIAVINLEVYFSIIVWL